jgi:hypothetical protein
MRKRKPITNTQWRIATLDLCKGVPPVVLYERLGIKRRWFFRRLKIERERLGLGVDFTSVVA